MEKSIADQNTGESVNDCQIVTYINQQFNKKQSEPNQYSPLALAFIGDGIYDLVIRTIILEQGNAPVNKLHKRVSGLVKAPAQVELFRKIEEHLSDEERAIYKRGRNAKSYTSAKNASISDYRIATGLEALFGYLYLSDRFPRIVELIKLGLESEEG